MTTDAIRLTAAPPTDRSRSFIGRLRRLPRAWAGGFFILIVLLGALFAPLIAPDGPTKQYRDGLSELGTPLPPSPRFPFGTDHLGRDQVARVLYGAQMSLFVSLSANLIAALVGTALGLLAGYYGGAIDFIIMRAVDVFLAFPAVLLALGIAAVLRPSMQVVILIVIVINVPTIIRLVRSQVLSIRERQFIESARAAGATDWRIIAQHILPHTITVTVIYATLGIATTVLLEASLSFLGVGVPPPTPSWGGMIADGQGRYRIAPWMILVPTGAILITTLGFNLLGDAIRDALDPRTSLRP